MVERASPRSWRRWNRLSRKTELPLADADRSASRGGRTLACDDATGLPAVARCRWRSRGDCSSTNCAKPRPACRRSSRAPIRALFRALGDEGAGAPAVRPPSAPRHSRSAGSAAAAFRSHHPGRTERRHLAARAPAPIPGSRGRCARRWAWNSRSARIGLAAHDFAMLAAGPRRAADPRAESRRRAHRRLALAAAADATDAGLGLDRSARSRDATMLAMARALAGRCRAGAAHAAARAHAAGRRRGRAACRSPRSRPGCAIPMPSMPGMC